MILIGLTGGIGSGKTTVAHLFHEYGIPIYIADDEAKKLMHHGIVKEEIIALFGPESYDAQDQLNRKWIADRVFNDQELLDRLNQIVHPRVEAHFKQWVSEQTSPYILYEAAILFETGRYKDFDYTILVTAPKHLRISRLLERDRTTEAQIKARMDNQWPDEKKVELADWVISNKNIANTAKQVAQIHKFISNL